MRVCTFLLLSSVYCVTVSVLDFCDMCFIHFRTIYFSQKRKKAFLCFERPILTTKSQHWPLFLWADTFHLERRVLLHENEMTLVRQQHLLWLRTWHAFSLMPLLPTTYSFCAKFCTYITHCCRCTIILYKMYHTVIVPSLFMIFPSKATSKKLIGLGSLQDFCRTIYLI